MMTVLAMATVTLKVTVGGGGGGVDRTMSVMATAMVVMVAGILGVANLIEVRKANPQLEYGFHCMNNHLDRAQ